VFANEGIFGRRSFRTPGSMVAVAVDVMYLSRCAAAVKLECENDTRKCVEVPVRDSEVTTQRIGEQQIRKHHKIPPEETKERGRTNKPSAPTFTRLKLV
jgi:hypothetical protein